MRETKKNVHRYVHFTILQNVFLFSLKELTAVNSCHTFEQTCQLLVFFFIFEIRLVYDNLKIENEVESPDAQPLWVRNFFACESLINSVEQQICQFCFYHYQPVLAFEEHDSSFL